MDCVLSAVVATAPQSGQGAGAAPEATNGGARVSEAPGSRVRRAGAGAGGLDSRRGGGRGPGLGADLPGGAEADNVAESGEESEEEWNYYRVEPTGDKESTAPQETNSEAEDMESQLNPNAAVFIPSSPTENSNHIEQPFNENLSQEEFFNKENIMSSSFIAHVPVSGLETSPIEALNGKDDEVWLSSSPKKGGVPLDNVCVPPEDEFDREVSQRPGDLNIENHFNGVNGGDSLMTNLENGQKILDHGICSSGNEVQETVTIVEKSNPFIAPSGEFSVHEMENQLNVIEEDCEIQPAEEPIVKVESSVLIETAPEPSMVAPLPEEPLGNVDLLGDMGASDGKFEDFKPSDNQHSPIVSGASDFAAHGTTQVGDFLKAPSYNCGTSACDESTGLLNEGILYSTSGFDNIMNTQSVDAGHSSPYLTNCGAQSTPFEDGTFEYETSHKDVPLELEKREQILDLAVPEAEIKADVDLQFEREEEEQICTELESDLNKAFAEHSTNFASDAFSGVEENQLLPSEAHGNYSDFTAQSPVQSEAAEQLLTLEEEPPRTVLSPEIDQLPASPLPEQTAADADLALSPTASAEQFVDFKPESPVQSPQIPEPLPRNDIFSLTSDAPAVPDFCSNPFEEKVVLISENNTVTNEPKEELKIGQDLETEQEPIFEPEPVIKQNLDIEQEPKIVQELQIEVEAEPEVNQELKIEQEAEPELNQDLNIEQEPEIELEPVAVQGLVNGSGESASSDVIPCVSPPPIVENVMEQVMSVDLQSACPPEIPEVIEIPDTPVSGTRAATDESVIIESTPEADDTTGKSVVAAVGAAAVVAAAGAAGAAAAAAAVSKMDKKPAVKGPVAKAKPLPAAKAPAKASTKATSAASATAPKKSVVPPVPAARAAPRTTAPPKPKPLEVASKPTTTVTKPAPPKPRTTVPATKPAEKKPLTNGDASKAAAAKPLARPSTRPQTAPARTTSKPAPAAPGTVTKALSAAPATTRATPVRKAPATTIPPKPKPATSTVSEIKPKPTTVASARPRPSTASSVGSAKPALSTARNPLVKSIDKQTKETTNKLISATRTTVSRTTNSTASKTTASKTSSTATNKAPQSKPAPIKKVPGSAGTTKVTAVKKPIDKSKDPLTNGVVKNGHASPEEMPVQNGVSHDETVIDKRESDLKIELLVDNQLVA